MPDVTARIESVSAAVSKLRADLPAIEWRAGQMLAQLGELAAIVGELAAGAGSVQTSPTAVADREREQSRRQATIEHLAWLACRGLPPGLIGPDRDAELCRVLPRWGVTDRELRGLGYLAGAEK
jgi:hypothetical protein